jgi:hypothetical protein
MIEGFRKFFLKAAPANEILYYDTSLYASAVFEADNNSAVTFRAPAPAIAAVLWADALLEL